MPTGLVWDLIARDQASPAFLRVAGAADKAAASTERASLAMSKSAATMGKVGATLTKTVTLPIAGLAAVAVDQAAKFQRSLNTIANATDQTSKQMQAASTGLFAIASKTGTSLGQLTDGLYTVEKGGLRGAKALATVQAAAEGAKAENADLGTVTNALTSIMASYGTKLSNPVAAMNELIRGSGLAKTTLQDFAGSLSTVVPLAARAGIGFDQVAGAVDTLTQHGTSAQEATQELANLIRNLQAPSQVAQKAMQQVGLSVVDVTKNLGKKGLIGTLGEVEDAVSSHLGPSGLVAVNVFKKSASASADLQTMISAMPKGLADVSKGLLDGSVSIKAYQADAKSLGGAAGAGALQFLSLFKSSEGFNDLLKSGQPNLRTAAAELKEMLGGSTALNAALQLSGPSAKYFASASDSVAKAASSAGADVLGWSRTQDLFSTKVDQAKTNLQVLAVEVGTALLPVVTKIVGAVSSAVQWFDNLSKTKQSILLWSVGVAAAIGPVLTIGSRLILVGSSFTKLTTGIVNQAARFNTGLALNAEGVASAMGKINAAIGGAAIGVAVGSFTRNASTTTKWLGALGSAAAGAAIGFGTGGPLGAVIGGVAGGVSALATAFLGTGHSADAATLQIRADLAIQKQDASDLLSTLQSVNGAYDSTYKNAVISKLQSTGALNLAAKAGVNPQAIAQAALGNTSAIAAINAQAAKLQAGTTRGGVTTYNTGALSAIQGIENALGLVGPAAKKAESDWELYTAAQGKTLVSSTLLAGGVKNLTKELGSYGTALSTSSDKQVASSAYAARNSEVLKENVQALNTVATAQLKHGASVKTVAGDYLSQINALQANAQKLGFNKDAVQALITKYASVPKSVVTALEQQGISTINPALFGLLRLYASVPGRVSTTVTANTAPAQQAIQTFVNTPAVKYVQVVTRGGAAPSGGHALLGNANGGGVPEGVSAVGERGAELLVKHGSDVQVVPNGPARGIAKHLGMLGVTVPGFASGTTPTKTAELARIAASARALTQRIRGSDILTITKDLALTVADTKQGFASLLNDVAKAGGQSPLVRVITAVQNGLTAVQSKALAAKTLLTDMTTFRSSTQSTLSGAFNATEFGSVTDLINGLSGATGTNNTYAAEVNKLRGESKGNATLLGFVNQLAASGQTTTLATLAGASKSQLRQVSAGVSGYNASLTAGSDAATTAKYGTSVAAQAKVVNDLVAREHAFVGVVGQLAREIGHQKIEISFDKEELSAKVTNSREFSKVLSELEHLMAKGVK